MWKALPILDRWRSIEKFTTLGSKTWNVPLLEEDEITWKEDKSIRDNGDVTQDGLEKVKGMDDGTSEGI